LNKEQLYIEEIRTNGVLLLVYVKNNTQSHYQHSTFKWKTVETSFRWNTKLA